MQDIPGYRILDVLGRGGMATVYLAEQLSLGRRVALKVLAAGPGGVATHARFLREARIAASLAHPNIVAIFDFGVHEGLPYICMDHAAGGAVRADGVRMAPADVLRLVRDVCGALAYAHGQGVVHRDIKPDNLLRRADGTILLSDFGIARMLEPDAPLTAEGTSIGTPHYMSPEQLRGEPVDGRSDLYSLGVVLWELLVGARPYEGPDGWSIGTQHLTSPIPRLPAELSAVQPLLDDLLAKVPAQRPADARRVVATLDALLADAWLASAAPSGTATRATPSSTGRSPAPAADTRRGEGSVAGRGMPRAPWRRWTAWPAAGAALLIACLAAAALLVGTQARHVSGARARTSRLPVGPPAALAPAAPNRSIAVLPFTDLSADGANRYFADGISEEILNVLAKVDGMEVSPRTSSFAFAGGGQGASAIARKLGVHYLLQGSVRKAGNRVRITAQLVDATRDRQLWSDAYERELTDIFKIQEDIANAIVGAMPLPGDASGGRPVVVVPKVTGNERAYDDYLRARELFIARDDLGESLRLYRKVTRADPGFAKAWEGLAAVASIARSWGLSGQDFDGLARSAADRALQLDPTLSTPWGVLGKLEQRRAPVDWDRSLALLDRAVAADPGNANGYQWRGLAWLDLGQFDKALVDFQRCLRVDPSYLNCERQAALAKLYAGDRAGALALFSKGYAKGFTGRSAAFLQPLAQAGQIGEVEALLDTAGAPKPGREALLRVLLSRGEPTPEARTALRAYLATGPGSAFAARVSPRTALWLGDYDAVAGAEDIDLAQLLVWETWPPAYLASAGRNRLISRFGLPAYWARHGFPARCQPSGSAGFHCR